MTRIESKTFSPINQIYTRFCYFFLFCFGRNALRTKMNIINIPLVIEMKMFNILLTIFISITDGKSFRSPWYST